MYRIAVASVQLCGKRVKVFEAEPKSSSRDGVRDDDCRRTSGHGSQSKSPSDLFSGSSVVSPTVLDMEKNPRFWAWMCQQGINLQHVKDSWTTIRSLQCRFMQENSSSLSNTPPQSLTPSEDWVRLWLQPSLLA